MTSIARNTTTIDKGSSKKAKGPHGKEVTTRVNTMQNDSLMDEQLMNQASVANVDDLNPLEEFD